MKVLFAVNNDNISDAIVKKYQKEYREILSYKNVYYFNAILKELQKDKTYDRVVISEDLEPFANNNYDTIDKFLFDKLDNISDEATDENGNDTEIILICADRRTKSDEMMVKLFGIGVYSALIGQDRSIDEVCRLINKPRTKKEAKLYYKIDSENVNYQSEDENNVSEAEVQNILAHYKRLGKNEDKYVDSFNNIVSQYTDTQLKIIIRYLPMHVKAVLEEKSPKYQELVTFTRGTNEIDVNKKYKQKPEKYIPNQIKKNDKVKIDLIEKKLSESKITKPIVIPEGINNVGVKKLIKEENIVEDDIITEPSNSIDDILSELNEPEEIVNEFEEQANIKADSIDDILSELEESDPELGNITETEEKTKRGRGRPRKVIPQNEQSEQKPKRGRGRPRKIEPKELKEAIDDILPNVDTSSKIVEEEPIDLFALHSEEEVEQNSSPNLFGLDSEEEVDQNNSPNLFGLDDEENDEKGTDQDHSSDLFGDGDNSFIDNSINDMGESSFANKTNNEVMNTSYSGINSFNSLLTKDKKVVAFVGTTKNGTSFIVNNVAQLLSSAGISTAILDMTKSRNAYYIYTKNEENLRQTATNSIYKLKNGIVDGIRVNKDLTVFTSLPGEEKDYSDSESILTTLVKNYSLVLIDCDFNTDMGYFANAQEIYLVQSMDVLTIQPLTAFLRNLKSKNVLQQEKIKIVVNKEQKLRGLSIKTLIGGMAFYNDPAMSYMTELFDKDKTPYCSIPFEIQTYLKYLEGLVNCEITIDGYSKSFMEKLKELGNMVYPLISRREYSPRGDKYKDNFSSNMNDTLNKMKRNYK